MFGWDIWRVQFCQHVLTRKNQTYLHTLLQSGLQSILSLSSPSLWAKFTLFARNKIKWHINTYVYYIRLFCPFVDNHACILDEIITIQLPISSILKATRTILLWQFLLYLDFQILTELHGFSLKIIYFFLKIFIRFNKLSNLKCEFQ